MTDKIIKDFKNEQLEALASVLINMVKQGNEKYVIDTLEETFSKALKQAEEEGYKRGIRDTENISNATIMRLELMGVTLAARQKDTKGAQIINDIKENYKRLLSNLKEK